ncbi:multidrug effflux MFS transporter [Pseudoroseicyclus sp. CLL3-39]|uniref:Multidrug effflux MFS transporter n=2 Tax=Pseudoroseicyclus tamaricis TaxID=2705421 RepID=A0A6B2JZT2_9RHOB|nr:multidrug effflux MFS transporter [Pseudoroseicyclus tamaricis]
MGRFEFIALMAALTATVALSVDSMLPALPYIAETLSPGEPNKAQLIVTFFLFGMGLGTFFAGPLSDSIGRKPAMLIGAGLYLAGAFLSTMSHSLGWMLAARVLQGLGAAAPRVIALACVRDRFEGNEMARLLSFVMMIFALLTALAPLLGTGILFLADWRGIFAFLAIFSLATTIWMVSRLEETLPADRRRELRFTPLKTAFLEVVREPLARRSTALQALIFAMLFATLSSIQQLFEASFGLGESFPLWFGGVAVIASMGGPLNARIVGRVGMGNVVRGMMWAQIGLVALMLAGWLWAPESWHFPLFYLWLISIFFQMGLCMGNLNALALQPLGHVAGMAASMITAFGTVAATLIAGPIGLAFNGTPVPLGLGVLVLAVLARGIAQKL